MTCAFHTRSAGASPWPSPPPIISGFSVYLNGRFVKLFDDPTLLAAVRNGLVGLALVGIAVGAGTCRRSGDIERHGQPSKWLTLGACRVLKATGNPEGLCAM